MMFFLRKVKESLIDFFHRSIPVISLLLSLFIVFFILSVTQMTIIGGCFNNKMSYGWPAPVYDIVTKCYSCCDTNYMKLPYREFNYFGLVSDLVFYLATMYLIYRSYKFAKKILIFVKNYI